MVCCRRVNFLWLQSTGLQSAGMARPVHAPAQQTGWETQWCTRAFWKVTHAGTHTNTEQRQSLFVTRNLRHTVEMDSNQCMVAPRFNNHHIWRPHFQDSKQMLGHTNSGISLRWLPNKTKSWMLTFAGERAWLFLSCSRSHPRRPDAVYSNTQNPWENQEVKVPSVKTVTMSDLTGASKNVTANGEKHSQQTEMSETRQEFYLKVSG